MGWWLKRVYWTKERDDADHWRTWGQLTDPPGRDSDWWEQEGLPKPGEANPRHGPRYQEGDLVVVCIAGSRGCPGDLVRRCPAIYKVVAAPRWDPDGVDSGLPDDDEWGKEGDRWGVMTEVSCIHAVNSEDGPYPEAFGAELRPGSRSPHIGLDDLIGQEAKRVLEQIEHGDTAPAPPTSRRDQRSRVTEIPIEEGDVEGYNVTTKAETKQAHRKERGLVADYIKFLGEPDEIIRRHKIDAPDTAGPLYSDIFHTGRRQLIEAKADSSRGSVRMAIGQLADYARFIDPPLDCAILLPAKPSRDLMELLSRQGVNAIWREGPRFRDNAGGAFT